MARTCRRASKDNRRRRGQVQAANLRIRHGNGQAGLGICRQQRFRQALGFASKDQKISGRKASLRVGPRRLGGQKMQTRAARCAVAKRGPIRPRPPGHLLPVIHPGPFQGPVVEAESERLDQMQHRIRRGAETRDGAGIRRNLRLDQNDLQVMGRRALDSCAARSFAIERNP